MQLKSTLENKSLKTLNIKKEKNKKQKRKPDLNRKFPSVKWEEKKSIIKSLS